MAHYELIAGVSLPLISFVFVYIGIKLYELSDDYYFLKVFSCGLGWLFASLEFVVIAMICRSGGATELADLFAIMWYVALIGLIIYITYELILWFVGSLHTLDTKKKGRYD